ncbi:MAG: sigma-70 family RNA polymerase sigma factor [Ilumatobacter sp.]|uniref:sigma-70 family RNA polymerase sigma factor n=1 Tax=Ilumatobacter sp. TaxID=1967498 RepID=UPI00391952FD
MSALETEPADLAASPRRSACDGSLVGGAAMAWPDFVESIYRERFGELCHLARRLVDTTHSAEEVVQEAFSRFVALQRPPAPGKELSYLRSIVINEARSVLRRRQLSDRHRPTRPPATSRDAADEALHRLEARRLWESITDLPQRQRQVVALRHVFDMSERETARLLSISAGSVKTHASRGLSTVRRLTNDGER